MKKVVLCVLITILMIMVLSGCAKVISSESKEVEVTITDTYKRGSYTTFIHSGKSMIPITHAATYKIYVSYDGTEYSISGSKTYHAFKDKVGKKVKAISVTNTYDNGRTYSNITELIDE